MTRIFRRPYRNTDDDRGPWLISVQMSFPDRGDAEIVALALNTLKAIAAIRGESLSLRLGRVIRAEATKATRELP